MNEQCKVCKKYKWDCGHHFTDDLGHINYDIPSEYICDKYGNCVSFEETRTKYQIALTNILENESKIKMYIPKLPLGLCFPELSGTDIYKDYYNLLHGPQFYYKDIENIDLTMYQY